MYIPQDPGPEACADEPYNEQYLLYAAELGAPQETHALVNFLGELDLAGGFSAYMKATRGMFSSIAQQAPMYAKCESSMMQWFGSAVQAMQRFDYTEHPLARPAAAYQYRRYRSTVSGAYLATDATLCYTGSSSSAGSDGDSDSDAHVLVSSSSMDDYIRTMTLGRLADRALRVWRRQPARAFVPVLFLYNAELVLLVFDQKACRRMAVGRLFREAWAKRGCKMTAVEKTLRVLWFLLIQRPADFGHGIGGAGGAGVLTVPGAIRFGGSKARATVEAKNNGSADRDDSNLVAVGGCLQGPQSILAPKRHVFQARFKGRDAVLKISWKSAHAVPEGAVLDVLQSGDGTPGVPKVYASGILCRGLLGHRLEFILVEDCGPSVAELVHHRHPLGSASRASEAPYRVVESVVRSAPALLAGAASAGVLHCNVQAEGISVHDGRVMLVHWDNARLLPSHRALSGDRAVGLERHWELPVRRIAMRQTADDFDTAPSAYQSIRALAGHRHMLTAADDLESLFYLALHLVLCIEQDGKAAAAGFLGFGCLPPRDAVRRRADAMACQKTYLELVGIQRCPVYLARRLDGLFASLFVRRGRSISHEMLASRDSPRGRVAGSSSHARSGGSGGSSSSSLGRQGQSQGQGQGQNGDHWRPIRPSAVGSSGESKKVRHSAQPATGKQQQQQQQQR
ncbi:hypothetical protein LPJ53_006360 [Coemansia erecta]|uniref:Uncharacterized protein n=1 Tax=Coemansia erecta TaxID=147472 RepID=A0A9W7XV82_9FUNG|nr:hypothetical protein LPJ53_006360 [Coemansia erecta]